MRYLTITYSIMGLMTLLAACAPANTPAPIVNTIPSLTETPIVSTIPAVTPTPALAAPTTEPTHPPALAVLPAPVYYLASAGPTQQIWRVDTDGSTRTQITKESASVTDFDVSPGDGSVAYVSGNALIKAD